MLNIAGASPAETQYFLEPNIALRFYKKDTCKDIIVQRSEVFQRIYHRCY